MRRRPNRAFPHWQALSGTRRSCILLALRAISLRAARLLAGFCCHCIGVPFGLYLERATVRPLPRFYPPGTAASADFLPFVVSPAFGFPPCRLQDLPGPISIK